MSAAPKTPGPPRRVPTLLVVEDGYHLLGASYAATGKAVGPAVVSTAVTGYQELVTDPANAGAVLVMTAPHIGNTGVNRTDARSERPQVSAIVVREPARRASSWLAQGELEDELAAAGVVGVCELDTRALTRHLRDHGPKRVGVFTLDEGALAQELGPLAAVPAQTVAACVAAITSHPQSPLQEKA